MKTFALARALGPLLTLATSLVAATPNVDLAPRLTPPPGIDIPDGVRTTLSNQTARLEREIEFVEFRLQDRPALRALLPDVQIFHKAVNWALCYDEFLGSNDVAIAQRLLDEGQRRVESLRQGQAPWITATGLVVRGYRSRLDDSIQPYGLVVPSAGAVNPQQPRRLDVWLHGRDNHLTELKFLADRQRSPGEFAPANTVVLHPYGRFCNAFKFAGETDVFEAIHAVEQHYAIDRNRRAIRGFSMGGAGCWHLAVHHPDFWAVAAPGAGFAETARYTRAFDRVPWPRAFEQRLWNWYDATAWAGNLRHCPTIAYSGERDKQKQAADVMAEAMQAEGLTLHHILGPGVEHRYEPGAKREVARQVDDAAQAGRPSDPDEVRLVTWTLRYPQLHWVKVEGLREHWRRATVHATRTDAGFRVTTENITLLTLTLNRATPTSAAGLSDPRHPRRFNVLIDQQPVTCTVAAGSPTLHLELRAGKWRPIESIPAALLRKKPGLQGPIDDAFLDRFLFVRPTGPAGVPAVAAWIDQALARATNEWRAQFRGEVRIKDDTAVTPEDLASSHLILWGDFQSNRLLGKLSGRWPLRWTPDRLELAGRGFPVRQAVPVFTYPNPLNPNRYVVVNSGFTFWRAGDASNAQQTPKLPDFAVLDVSLPLESIPQRGVITAGFFNEAWGW